MATYTFGIDETGVFDIMNPNDNSFVCGVLTIAKEEELKQAYRNLYVQCGFGNQQQIPNEKRQLLMPFHYNQLSINQKQICQQALLPFAKQVYYSKGKPLIVANNQHYWLSAFQTVIFELFKQNKFNQGDKIIIEFDARNTKYVGINDLPLVNDYNQKIIAEAIGKTLKPYQKKYIIEVKPRNDDNSFFVNFADIICGLVKYDKRLFEPTTLFSCNTQNFSVNQSPVKLIKNNPRNALLIILEEIDRQKFGNISLLSDCLNELRKDKKEYDSVWAYIVQFLRRSIDLRNTSPSVLKKLADLKAELEGEFTNSRELLSQSRQFEILYAFILFDTHSGAISSNYKDLLFDVINQNTKDKIRITDKWSDYIRISLANAQLQFNAYNFNDALTDFEKVYSIQEAFLKNDFPFSVEKDDTMATITGTLGQAYAFNQQLDDALFYFQLSEQYVSHKPFLTMSFFSSIYHRKGDLENLLVYFEKQSSFKAVEYLKSEDKNYYNILAYTRLRALSIHQKSDLNLAEIPLDLEIISSEYPIPLILKWKAFCVFETNKEQAKNLLEKGIKQLLSSSKFTIKSLAIPLIQMLYTLSDNHKYCREYDGLLGRLKDESPYFKEYCDSNDAINRLNNNLTLWDRALLLPFYYA